VVDVVVVGEESALALLLCGSVVVVFAVAGTADDSAEEETAAESLGTAAAVVPAAILGPAAPPMASPRLYVTPIRSYTSWTMSKAGLGPDLRPADRLRDRYAVRTSDGSYCFLG
jgi:hypothetical protein